MKISVKVTEEIQFGDIANLLCNAFEGGVGYWCEIADYRKPETVWQWETMLTDRVYRYVQYPLSEGGAVFLSDTEGDRDYVLNLAAIERGLQAMADIAPRHFADFMTGDADADTGDVFLQCCLFGEIRYG